MIDEQLEAEIEAAIQDVRDSRRETARRMVDMQLFHSGKTPFRMHKGVGAAWNFTSGPAFIYEGPRSIDTLNFVPMPVVVIARYIPEEELHKIEATRCYGFVFEQASVVDPTFWWLHDENRASVIGCPGILADVKPDEDVIVDGVRGRVYLSPDADTRTNYERLRALGAPQKDQLYWDALRRLTTLLVGSRKARKIEPPYEFAEQDRLIDITRRARHGKELSPADHEWMQGLLMEGMPSTEELLARAKELEQVAKMQPPKSSSRSGGRDARAGSSGGGSSSRRGAGDAPAARGGSGTKGSADASSETGAVGPDGRPDPLAGLKGAALRRAQREKEMEDARKRREQGE